MARKISKTDTRTGATAHGAGSIVFSLPFLGIGTYFALAGFRFIPLPAQANAPLWVVGCLGLAFAAAGLMVMVNGVRGAINKRRARAVADRHGEPWFQDHPWERDGINDRAERRVIHGFVMAAFMVVFLGPFNWWAFMSDESTLMVQLVVGVFDVILVFVVGQAFYRLIQFFKYGRSELRFERFPFFLGEKLEAVFSPNRFDRLKLVLRFVEERIETRRVGNKRRQRLVAYEHYSEELEPNVAAGMREVPFSFELPALEEWTTELSGKPVRYWELVVEAEAPGVDFRTTFPLPVYARPAA